MSSSVAVIILAAGHGTRMQSSLPKVCHPIAGLPMYQWVLKATEALNPEKTVIVVGTETQEISCPAGHYKVVQQERKGTGHAVQVAAAHLTDFKGSVLVLFGDTPFIETETLEAMLEHQGETGADLVVLGFDAMDPEGYGRLVLGRGDELVEIVEQLDLTDEQEEITLCNSGVMLLSEACVKKALGLLKPTNKKGEYYLTDLVKHCRELGLQTSVIETHEMEVMGINSRLDLAEAEHIAQDQLRFKIMSQGVTLLDPSTTYLSHDTVIGKDTLIEPNVFFGPGVRVGEGANIRSFSYIYGAEIGDRSIIGPFARLRPATKVGVGVRIGNFVEVKNTTVGDYAKANHLSYIGDAQIGEGSNIGAGTITCNYNGYTKTQTLIGKDVFVGSNSTLVAPLSLADGVYIGAGSVITKDVPENALGIERSEMKVVPEGAIKIRQRWEQKGKTAAKEAK